MLDMNTLVDLLNKTEYTRKTVDLIMAYPDVLLVRWYHL